MIKTSGVRGIVNMKEIFSRKNIQIGIAPRTSQEITRKKLIYHFINL